MISKERWKKMSRHTENNMNPHQSSIELIGTTKTDLVTATFKCRERIRELALEKRKLDSAKEKNLILDKEILTEEYMSKRILEEVEKQKRILKDLMVEKNDLIKTYKQYHKENYLIKDKIESLKRKQSPARFSKPGKNVSDALESPS